MLTALVEERGGFRRLDKRIAAFRSDCVDDLHKALLFEQLIGCDLLELELTTSANEAHQLQPRQHAKPLLDHSHAPAVKKARGQQRHTPRRMKVAEMNTEMASLANGALSKPTSGSSISDPTERRLHGSAI